MRHLGQDRQPPEEEHIKCDRCGHIVSTVGHKLRRDGADVMFCSKCGWETPVDGI